jgi:ABC-2 type transport system permease protein
MSKTIYNIIKDEFRAIFTDSGAMLLLCFATMIYTLIYSIAYGSEVVRSVAVAVVDEDNTPSSRNLIKGLTGGPNTDVSYEVQTINEAQRLFYSNEVYGIIYIPDGYEYHLQGGRATNIAAILDGSHMLLYKQVLEQLSYDALYAGASVETAELIANGNNALDIEGIVNPLTLATTHLYNPSLGYGSFVMPSILIVIIQQTLIIGIAMINARRRNRGDATVSKSYLQATKVVIAKILVYIIIYAINLTLILGLIWPIFGFPFSERVSDIVILLLIYLVTSTALALAISHIFTRRESPIILLLWSSVPILLLAGISYPKEAFPSILYDIGHIFPSSSTVDAFISIGTMGATLYDVRGEITTLIILAVLYLILAVYTEQRASCSTVIKRC